MRLFDDMERTFTGLAEVNESHFSFLIRSAIDRAVVDTRAVRAVV